MKSKTFIEKQLKRKTNSEVIETIIVAKKTKGWLEVAGLISTPRKKQSNVNLSRIEEEAKEGDVVIVPGKVLSQGELNKKVKIAALGFSGSAKEKILKSKSNIVSILEEIKSNPEGKGIKIIK
jgi:large subunit ribosomal protein L18e